MTLISVRVLQLIYQRSKPAAHRCVGLTPGLSIPGKGMSLTPKSVDCVEESSLSIRKGEPHFESYPFKIEMSIPFAKYFRIVDPGVKPV